MTPCYRLALVHALMLALSSGDSNSDLQAEAFSRLLAHIAYHGGTGADRSLAS